MRLALIALLLAAAPAPGGTARVAGPKVLGPEAPATAYSSVPLAGLVPLSAAEVGNVLKTRRSYPEHSRVPVWHQRNGNSRLISFRPGRKAGEGKAADANCEPAACVGTYTISGNIVIIDFKPRGRVMRLTFYKSPDGVAMMFDDWGPKDGRVSPY
ncbi:MAG: hypothetical protein ACAH11_06170 [Sphingomonas sp.]